MLCRAWYVSGMEDFMRDMPAKALRFISSPALVGLGFVIAGGLIARMGGVRLYALYLEYAPYFPLPPMDKASAWIFSSLPLIFRLFVIIVSSISAVLVGVLWFFSGLAEVIEARGFRQQPPDFERPDLTAESLRTSVPHYWSSRPWAIRMVTLVWPKARFMGPISYDVFRETLWTMVRVLLLIVLIMGLHRLLQLAPEIVKSLLNKQISFSVPHPGKLYYLLAAVILVNMVIGLSVIPFRSRLLETTRVPVSVRGGGESGAFMALIEEGCKLLSARGAQHIAPTRLEFEQTQSQGSLIEKSPDVTRAFSRPAAYVCVVLFLALLIVGFSRLVNFEEAAPSMAAVDFFSRLFLDYVVEVAFCFGIIISGLHFAEWSRRLLGIRTFRSFVVFCYEQKEELASRKQPSKRRIGVGGTGKAHTEWNIVRDADPAFTQWAKDPGKSSNFRMVLNWGVVFSEADFGEGRRHLIRSERSEALDKSMARILELPFHVNFRREVATVASPSQKQSVGLKGMKVADSPADSPDEAAVQKTNPEN
ncbi:hypothetical protein ACFL2Q_08825 [Thermodesulfobacteriota bacterium]